MELEKQVCSLELAKKLKELGVEQESLFVWHSDSPRYGWLLCSNDDKRYPLGTRRLSAFTVAELGEMLAHSKTLCSADKFGDEWHYHIHYMNGRSRKHKEGIETSEADARAKMLIYLIENNLITL